MARNDSLVSVITCHASGKLGMADSPLRIMIGGPGLVLGRNDVGHTEEQERATTEGVCWEPGQRSIWCPPLRALNYPLGQNPTGLQTQLLFSHPWQNPSAKDPMRSLQVGSASLYPPCSQVNRDTPQRDAMRMVRSVTQVLVMHLIERKNTGPVSVHRS